eukprot:1332204-Amorphochlora_amoeboformis.AAC.1
MQFISEDRLLIGNERGSMLCVNIFSKKTEFELKAHRKNILGISLDPTHQLAVTTSTDCVIVWNTASSTWVRQKSLVAMGAGICPAVFTEAGILLTYFSDEGIKGWKTKTYDEIFELSDSSRTKTSSKDGITCLATSDDGLIVVAGEARLGGFHVWDSTTGRKQTFELPPQCGEVVQIEFLPRSHLGGIVCRNGDILFVDLTSQTVELTIADAKDMGIASITLSPRSKYMAGIAHDGSIRIFDLQAVFKYTQRRLERMKMKVIHPDLVKPKLEEKLHSNLRSKTAKKAKPKLIKLDPDMSFTEAAESLLQTLVSTRRIQSILKETGELPKKYRFLIWRYQLKLPSNVESYKTLASRAPHPSVQNLRQEYPLRDKKLFQKLQVVLSCLAHWSPVCARFSYLPSLVFPFLHLMDGRDLDKFEVVLSFLLNWGGSWFRYFPNPPLEVLSRVSRLVEDQDPVLARHFSVQGWRIEEAAWLLMKTAFTTVLTDVAWLQLFDHVFSTDPGWYEAFTAAFFIGVRSNLLALETTDELDICLSNEIHRNISKIIHKAYRMHQGRTSQEFTAIPKGAYPQRAVRYPDLEVDSQLKEYARIEAAMRARVVPIEFEKR